MFLYIFLIITYFFSYTFHALYTSFIMQSEAQPTTKPCRYCKKDFQAWKRSLVFCSDLCKINEAFDEDLALLKQWEKVNKLLANPSLRASNFKRKGKKVSTNVLAFIYSMKTVRAANRLRIISGIKPITAKKAKT